MKRKLPLILLCLLFLGIAGYYGSRFYIQWNEYRIGESTYEALTRYVQIDPISSPKPAQPKDEADTIREAQPENTEPTAAREDTNWPVVDFSGLLDINPDVVGWIYIEGTNINYPVVQGTDNSYYLNHLLDGNRNSAGTIFLDYRNRRDLSDRNSVIYGHHMQNGTMFQQITKYKEQSFYDAHPVCLIMTPSGNYRLEFFAGYVIDMNSQAWKMDFASDEEYSKWLEDAISRSTFTSPVKPTAQDRVVTFSTCTYEYNDARFVLAGIIKP